MLGGAACEYPNGGVFSSIMIYSGFMTDALMTAETTEGYLTILEDTAARRVVPCRIGGQLFGVDVAQAGDMVVLSATVPVALAPARVRGVLSRHGRMATVIETHAALGLAPQDSKAAPSRVGLTVEHGGHLYVLAVDEVREIVALEDAREPITPLDLDAIVRPQLSRRPISRAYFPNRPLSASVAPFVVSPPTPLVASSSAPLAAPPRRSTPICCTTWAICCWRAARI